MSFVAVAIGGSAVVGAVSANKAAKAQTKAADAQLTLQREIYDDTSAKFQPFYDAGVNALGTYTDQLGAEYTKSPGYDFRLNQGLDAVKAHNNALGSINSGATMQALNDHAQGFASNDYNQWLNRWGQLMSSGQNAAGQQAAAGRNFAAGASDAYADRGNALAAGSIATGNAIQGGIQNGLSLWQYQNQRTQ